MSLPQCIDTYLAGADALRRAVSGMTPDQTRARPVPGKWSTLEVVAHLADFDALDALRMKHIIALERPVLFDADEHRFEATLGYPERDLENELSLIENTRRQMARILRGLPDAALARACEYRLPDRIEQRTLDQVLTKAINHVTHHLAFVLDKRRALGLS